MADPNVDIDLNDPELEKAATKIQATFKGYKVRQEKKGGKDEGAEAAAPVPPEEEVSAGRDSLRVEFLTR